jgi:hypothetical protein
MQKLNTVTEFMDAFDEEYQLSAKNRRYPDEVSVGLLILEREGEDEKNEFSFLLTDLNIPLKSVDGLLSEK